MSTPKHPGHAHLIHAFTNPNSPDTSGNPAAVLLLDSHDWPDISWMQQLAAHYNLSETAFVLPTDQPNTFGIRWFTPAAEVELCGHATLAAAHALWHNNHAHADQPINFHTQQRGQLTCTPTNDHLIAMDFPTEPIEPIDLQTITPDIPAALRCPQPIAAVRTPYDLILELPTAADVQAAAPDWPTLIQLSLPHFAENWRGLCLTARADHPDHDITSRFFAPNLRINEDPVTGSLHCALNPYWSERLGKTTLRCHQASERSGLLITTLHPPRVQLAGHAATIQTLPVPKL
ncbi:PhzF family phenazine biosynthesis protein [Mucisphaera sp.]|uniref:PhzF family phenazine biosynthesis protein n=1 Tax=Mucisphaera sp. TaxID=2913024 RepID=UPI003D1448D4